MQDNQSHNAVHHLLNQYCSNNDVLFLRHLSMLNATFIVFFFKFQLLLPALRASHAPLPTLFPRRDRQSDLQLVDGRVA